MKSSRTSTKCLTRFSKLANFWREKMKKTKNKKKKKGKKEWSINGTLISMRLLEGSMAYLSISTIRNVIFVWDFIYDSRFEPQKKKKLTEIDCLSNCVTAGTCRWQQIMQKITKSSIFPQVLRQPIFPLIFRDKFALKTIEENERERKRERTKKKSRQTLE